MKLQLVARELDPTAKVPLKLTGQELQAESYAVAQMNGIIHDMEIEIARGDTMINPKFRTADGTVRTHDIVVANPMWNQPFDARRLRQRSIRPLSHRRRRHHWQGRLGVAATYARLPQRSRPRSSGA